MTERSRLLKKVLETWDHVLRDVEAALSRKDYGTVIRLVYECPVPCRVEWDVVV